MHRPLVGAAAALALFAAPAAAETLRIGFITSLSGPAGVMGEDMRASVELAIKHLGGKVGGLETQMFYGDDQRQSDVGVSLARRMVERDRVHFVTGIIWSHVLMGVYKPVIDSGTFLISSNAGTSPLAGKLCAPNFFSVGFQNDQNPVALGQFMTDRGVDNVYVMAPNYPAGRDMVAGFKQTFKGKIVNEVFTRLGQGDYLAELSQVRAARPGAVYVFYPGDMGINFFRQYAEAGLKGQIPLYHVFSIDAVTLPAQRDAAAEVLGVMHWNPDLDNPQNKKFVADYVAAVGKEPSFYGAQSYDTILLIDSAVRAVGGNLNDKDGIREALRKADFPTVRGNFRFNRNHFPIQDFYLYHAIEEGGEWVARTIEKIAEDLGDPYVDECPMQW